MEPVGQGSKLHTSRQTQKAVAVAFPVATHIQTPGIEVTHPDVVTVRVATGGANVEQVEQINVADSLVGRQRPGHLGGVRDHHRPDDKCLLIRPVHVERVLDRLLAEREPVQRLDLVSADELLVRFVVPATVVLLRPLCAEEVDMDGSNVEHSHRGRRTCYEHHAALFEGFEGRLIREITPQQGKLGLGVSEATGRGDFLRCDEVWAQDGLCETVVGLHARGIHRNAPCMRPTLGERLSQNETSFLCPRNKAQKACLVEKFSIKELSHIRTLNLCTCQLNWRAFRLC